LGSNLFIDNLFVYGSESPEAINAPNTLAFTIYPNPSEALVQIEMLRHEVGGDVFLTMIDATGRIVLNTILNSQKMQLDVSNFSPGIYSLIAKYQDRIGVQRFLVMH
jgi:hypothetical protein